MKRHFLLSKFFLHLGAFLSANERLPKREDLKDSKWRERGRTCRRGRAAASRKTKVRPPKWPWSEVRFLSRGLVWILRRPRPCLREKKFTGFSRPLSWEEKMQSNAISFLVSQLKHVNHASIAHRLVMKIMNNARTHPNDEWETKGQLARKKHDVESVNFIWSPARRQKCL